MAQKCQLFSLVCEHKYILQSLNLVANINFLNIYIEIIYLLNFSQEESTEIPRLENKKYIKQIFRVAAHWMRLTTSFNYRLERL